jgi:hypothetical protein
VRATAFTLLARFKDEESLAALRAAVSGIDEKNHLSGAAVKELAKWLEYPAVPVLIEFLEHKYRSDYGWNFLEEAAVNAQLTLQKICGYTFPFDVEEGHRIWSQVEKLPEQERSLALSKMLPIVQPISAMAGSLKRFSSRRQVGSLKKRSSLTLEITLTNESERQIEIAGKIKMEMRLANRRTVDRNWDYEETQKWDQLIADWPSGFCTLQPHESITVNLNLDWTYTYLLVERTISELSILFVDINPVKHGGIFRWVGVVEVGNLPSCTVSECVKEQWRWLQRVLRSFK